MVVLEDLAQTKKDSTTRKVSERQLIAVKKSGMHLLLLMSKKLLLRVGAKERDAIVPKVSKLKTLSDQTNALQVRNVSF